MVRKNYFSGDEKGNNNKTTQEEERPAIRYYFSVDEKVNRRWSNGKIFEIRFGKKTTRKIELRHRCL